MNPLEDRYEKPSSAEIEQDLQPLLKMGFKRDKSIQDHMYNYSRGFRTDRLDVLLCNVYWNSTTGFLTIRWYPPDERGQSQITVPKVNAKEVPKIVDGHLLSRVQLSLPENLMEQLPHMRDELIKMKFIHTKVSDLSHIFSREFIKTEGETPETVRVTVEWNALLRKDGENHRNHLTILISPSRYGSSIFEPNILPSEVPTKLNEHLKQFGFEI